MPLTLQLSVINFCITLPVLKEDSVVGRLCYICIVLLKVHLQKDSPNPETCNWGRSLKYTSCRVLFLKGRCRHPCISLYTCLTEELPAFSQVSDYWRLREGAAVTVLKEGRKSNTLLLPWKKREHVCACLVIDVNLILQYNTNTYLASRNTFSSFFSPFLCCSWEGGKSSLIRCQASSSHSKGKRKILNTCKTWMHCVK